MIILIRSSKSLCDVTHDKIAPILFEGAVHLLFLSVGATGYSYAAPKEKFKKWLFPASMKVLWIDGFFFGLVAGELLCLMFMQRYSALPSYLVVLGTLFLLTTVPVGIVEFVLTEKQRQLEFMFLDKRSPRLFSFCSFVTAMIGLVGFVNLAWRFLGP